MKLIEKLKLQWKNSYYICRIRQNAALILVSLILSILLAMITYPGVWFTDSYVRAETANNILYNGFQILRGSPDIPPIKSWLTAAPSFLIAFCKIFTGNFGSYTVLQAFVFFAGSFLLIKKMGALSGGRSISFSRWILCSMECPCSGIRLSAAPPGSRF